MGPGRASAWPGRHGRLCYENSPARRIASFVAPAFDTRLPQQTSRAAVGGRSRHWPDAGSSPDRMTMPMVRDCRPLGLDICRQRIGENVRQHQIERTMRLEL